MAVSAFGPLAGLLVIGASILASGCLSPGDSLDKGLVIQGHTCPQAVADHCSWDGRTLKIQGVDIETDDITGIRVRGLTGPLIMQDVEIRGPAIGVSIKPCASCNITLSNITVQSGGVGISVSYPDGSTGSIRIEHASIHAKLGSGANGIQASHSQSLHLVDVNFTGGEGGSAVISDGELDARNINMADYYWGFYWNGSHARIQDMIFSCTQWLMGEAIRVEQHEATLNLENVRLEGCPGSGEYELEDGRPAKVKSKGIMMTNGSLVARGLEIVNMARAIEVRNQMDIHLENFVLNGSEAGEAGIYHEWRFSWATPRFEHRFTTLKNGVIENFGNAGIHLMMRDLDIDNVTFRDNGADPEPASILLFTGGILFWVPEDGFRSPIPGERSIRNSSFVGNTGYGLRILSSIDVAPQDPYLDASLNWWNHPMGPSPSIVGIAPQYGDRVSAGVRTSPHLSEAPA